MKIIPPRKKLLPRQQRQTNTKDHEGIKETFQKKKNKNIIKKLKRIYETPLEIKEVMRIFWIFESVGKKYCWFFLRYKAIFSKFIMGKQAP